ncbi:MAG: peptidylprolyl isomerase [Chlorobiales bacterium]|nr:peptidylprolyl isomerase [Chlorobiales bacterium]
MTTAFKIKTTLGDITLSLYDDTPQHKKNFEKLVKENYYDGIRFHRVIEGFMIQTGDPLSRSDDNRMLHGTGGPDYRIPAEIKHPNLKGSLAAARDNNPQKASSGSQFYINQADNDFLDGEYTVFGMVTDGLDVVDKIATVEKDFNDNPVDPVTIETIEAIQGQK